jgi:hypothetical protein
MTDFEDFRTDADRVSGSAEDRPCPFASTAEGQLALVLWLAWNRVGGPPDAYTGYLTQQVLERLRSDQDLSHPQLAEFLVT